MNNETQAQANGAVSYVNDTGIDMTVLIDEHKLSKSYVEQYTRDFPKLDNLVDGVALNNNPNAPLVGDTTLAGLVRAIPRNSLQQLPVFSCVVNGTKNSVPALLCSFLLKKTAFNEDTFGKGLLSTLQIGAEQALSHGYAPFMSAMGSMYNDFGTAMRLLHYSDTSPEPGITDANESGYHYVTASLTPSRVRKILRDAKKNENTNWIVPMLQQVLNSTPRAKDYSIYESEARKNSSGEQTGPTYEFVTRYPVGSPDEPIVTFCPEVSDGPLRVMESKSKWGYPRVQYLVIDPASLTPFGVSRVRLASPNQNLMNIYYGNIASMLLLNSKPPILKKGRFLKPVQLKQGAVWETLDIQATAELKSLDNGSLATFVNIQQQFAAQIQNIMGQPTGTLNGNSNAFGFSKTAPGVKQQTDVANLTTNQITKILENFLRQYALVALDTLISESTGETNLIVDDKTKNAVNQLKPGAVGDDNTIKITWEDFYAAIKDWSVDIDQSLSQDQLEEKSRGDLQDMLVVLAQNAADLGPEAVEKVKEITNMLLQDAAPAVGTIPLGGPTVPQGALPGGPLPPPGTPPPPPPVQ